MSADQLEEDDDKKKQIKMKYRKKERKKPFLIDAKVLDAYGRCSKSKYNKRKRNGM